MKVLVAVPSAGKTHLKQTHEGVIDTDDILDSMFGGHYRDIWEEKGLSIEEMIEIFITKAKEAEAELIVTNFHSFITNEIKLELHLAYFGKRDYIRHIVFSGRMDLIESFGSEELESWVDTIESDVAPLVKPTNLHILNYDDYLDSIYNKVMF